MDPKGNNVPSISRKTSVTNKLLPGRGAGPTTEQQFTPQVLAAVQFAGGTAAAELLAAVQILRTLNATGTRRVPTDGPTGFVPTRWRGYLDAAQAAGNTSAYRHFWELCTLLGLRDGLRTGDVYVPGSRRYSDPAAYLLTTQAWSPAAQLVAIDRCARSPWAPNSMSSSAG